ncbi:TetR/AcrR family transcriptional regulator [Trinickia violacea]|uniref:TetR/AcrR family transcriptional regulator n=1 Tax=Trinickia violacea TaxID=2571746 RepID=A0A4V1EH84_9BURK|nr:TetR/AcrR family transcriptional regulator [Trinickia violacea]QCP49380.1 TetR/AcrR family transcriptional regulator [Trinickia violacea]
MGIAERKNRQKQALRERILEASRAIVMREGFAALSMRKIADAIEYSPATLYLHFESRDDIARALCAEGYDQLLASLAPHARIVEPQARLRAIAHAYVAFGLANRETYRLIFMEDPSYTDSALGGASAGGASSEAGQAAAEGANPEAGDAAFRLLIDSVDELKAAGRVSASADSHTWVEALWATLHGIVALTLTCPVYPQSPVEKLVDAAIDAWFGAPDAKRSPRAAGGTRSRTAAKRKAADANAQTNAQADSPLAASDTAPAERDGKVSA